jgi:hypothetical protein
MFICLSATDAQDLERVYVKRNAPDRTLVKNRTPRCGVDGVIRGDATIIWNLGSGAIPRKSLLLSGKWFSRLYASPQPTGRIAIVLILLGNSIRSE